MSGKAGGKDPCRGIQREGFQGQHCDHDLLEELQVEREWPAISDQNQRLSALRMITRGRRYETDFGTGSGKMGQFRLKNWQV